MSPPRPKPATAGPAEEVPVFVPDFLELVRAARDAPADPARRLALADYLGEIGLPAAAVVADAILDTEQGVLIATILDFRVETGRVTQSLLDRIERKRLRHTQRE
jgi:hypothetical protein